MEFKCVFTETMSGQFLHILGDVDDLDGLEGTFLDTDPTTYTKYLGDLHNLGLRSYFDANFLCFVDWATLLTLLLATLRLALFGIDDGDSVLVFHLC